MAIALVANGSWASPDGNGGTSAAIDTSGSNFLVLKVSSTTIGNAVSDSKANTWIPLTAYQDVFALGIRFVQIFYVENATVGSGHTFTIAGTGNFPSLCFASFSGVATSSSFDVENGNAASATNISTGSVTPSINNELVVAALAYDDSTTVSVDSGFTITDQVALVGGAHIGGALAYLTQTTAAAANPNFSWTSSNLCEASIATFKAAAAADTLFAQSVM